MSCPGAIEYRRDTKNRRRRTIHGWTVTSRLTSLSNGVIVNAVNVFTNASAELAVLRLPTFIEEIRSERYSENKALIGAFLAVTTAQLLAPKLQIVQALLIIALHEGGEGLPQGMDVQLYHPSTDLNSAQATNRQYDAVSMAIETRTYWACLIMDCMVNSDTSNPPMLPML
ncbi:hypothetical protein E4U34_005620 [Claviceps purpurea]|nr:hypothetical protein E4U34_005620 [Claviceps purpurea]